MDERGPLFLIEHDLSDAWIDEFAAQGVRAIEDLLAKHLAFLSFLDES